METRLQPHPLSVCVPFFLQRVVVCLWQNYTTGVYLLTFRWQAGQPTLIYHFKPSVQRNAQKQSDWSEGTTDLESVTCTGLPSSYQASKLPVWLSSRPRAHPTNYATWLTMPTMLPGRLTEVLTLQDHKGCSTIPIVQFL